MTGKEGKQHERLVTLAKWLVSLEGRPEGRSVSLQEIIEEAKHALDEAKK